MSHLEAQFATQLKAAKLPEPVRELRVHGTRRFRFDFAWPDSKVAVEIEGGAPELGHHHTSRKGYLSDCRKYNLAVSMGWRVLRFTAKQVRTGEALLWTELLLSGKTIPYDGPTRKGSARKGAPALETPDRRGSRGRGKEVPRGSAGARSVEDEQVGQARDLRAELAHTERAARSVEAGAAADQGCGEGRRDAERDHAEGDRRLHGAGR